MENLDRRLEDREVNGPCLNMYSTTRVGYGGGAIFIR